MNVEMVEFIFRALLVLEGLCFLISVFYLVQAIYYKGKEMNAEEKKRSIRVRSDAEHVEWENAVHQVLVRKDKAQSAFRNGLFGILFTIVALKGTEMLWLYVN